LWLQYADDAYDAIIENEEYLVYGELLDDIDDEEGMMNQFKCEEQKMEQI
jgi:hypothetical protein